MPRNGTPVVKKKKISNALPTLGGKGFPDQC